MDDSEIIFIEDDERNAASRDHRATQRPRVQSVTVPSRTRHVVVRSGGREPTVMREAAPVAERVMYPYPSYPQPERRVFGNLTVSEAVEVAAQALAALQPLPVAPVATGKVEIDVENLGLYHAALALHAKRDEQLRTIGSLLAKLMS